MEITENSKEQQKDFDLVDLLQSSEDKNQGYRLLMESYQHILYSHIYRIVGNHQDTDDVLQDVFVKVFRSIDNFQKRSKLSTWLYRIASNEAITLLRKRKTRTETLDSLVNMGIHTNPSSEEYDASHIQELLNSAINSLPEKQRVVFLLRYYDELPYKEISEITGTSIGGLKASFHIAVKKVKDFVTSNRR